MNIGFIYGIQTYPPETGGSIHGYQLAKGLTNRGHRLYSWYYGDDASPYCSHFRGRELFRFLRAIDVLYIRIDWAQLLRWRDPLQLVLRTRIPTVYEINGLPEEIRYNPGLSLNLENIAARLRSLARRGHAAIGVSEKIRVFLDEDIGFRKAYCIPNGSDPVTFSPCAITSEPGAALQVVWMGSTHAGWHDIDAILEAARILDERRIKVVIRLYGDPAHLPGQLPANVKACGHATYDRIGAEIRDANVGLHVWRSVQGATIDGSPLKTFDYMACGLAVIMQEGGQKGEIIREWDNGLITSGTPVDLADKIQFLEGDRKLCARLGENGRRAVIEYYNWDRVAAETEAVLADLLSQIAPR